MHFISGPDHMSVCVHLGCSAILRHHLVGHGVVLQLHVGCFYVLGGRSWGDMMVMLASQYVGVGLEEHGAVGLARGTRWSG